MKNKKKKSYLVMGGLSILIIACIAAAIWNVPSNNENPEAINNDIQTAHEIARIDALYIRDAMKLFTLDKMLEEEITPDTPEWNDLRNELREDIRRHIKAANDLSAFETKNGKETEKDYNLAEITNRFISFVDSAFFESADPEQIKKALHDFDKKWGNTLSKESEGAHEGQADEVWMGMNRLIPVSQYDEAVLDIVFSELAENSLLIEHFTHGKTVYKIDGKEKMLRNTEGWKQSLLLLTENLESFYEKTNALTIPPERAESHELLLKEMGHVTAYAEVMRDYGLLLHDHPEADDFTKEMKSLIEAAETAMEDKMAAYEKRIKLMELEKNKK